MKSLLLALAPLVAAASVVPTPAAAQWTRIDAQNPWWWNPVIVDTCPVPSRAQCMSDETDASDPNQGFWSSRCGQEELARWQNDTSECRQYFDDSHENEFIADRGLHAAPVYVPPGERDDGEVVRSSYFMPYDYATHYAYGLTTLHEGWAQYERLVGLQVSPAVYADWTWHSVWDGNGNEVTSCNEYVHEKFYDYSTFLDAAAAFADDPRAVFNVAYRPGGLGDKGARNLPLTSKSGASKFQLDGWEASYPKNAFFAFTQTMPFVSQERYPIREDLMEALAMAPLEHHSFAWHRERSAQLGHVPDAVLYAMDDWQADFMRLLATRERLLEYYGAAWLRFTAMVERCGQQVGSEYVLLRNHPSIYVNPPPYELTNIANVFDPGSLGGSMMPMMAPAAAIEVARDVSYRAWDLPPELRQVIADNPGVVMDDRPHNVDWGEQLASPSSLPPPPAARGCDLSQAMAMVIWYGDEVAKRLRVLDRRIEAELIEAKDQGCLEPYDTTVCDWSPRQFVRDLSGQLGRSREKARARCLRYTNDRFGPDDRIRNAQTAGLEATAQNMAASTELVEAFFTAVQKKVGQIELPKDPQSGRLMVGNRAVDSQALGNDLVGLHYGYDVGWEATGLGNRNERTCAAQLETHAHFDANATLFGLNKILVGARNRINTYTRDGVDGIHSDLYLRILDNEQLIPEKWRGPRDFPVDSTTNQALSVHPDPYRKRHVLFEVRKTFPVGPIPVTLAAGAAGELGMSVGVNGTLTRSCVDPAGPARSDDQLSLEASLDAAPYASLDVYASAAVDILIASAGVRLDLTLLRLELPLKMAVRFGFLPPTPTELAIDVSGSLDLVLRALDGKISVFVDTLFGNLVTETIFRWKGPSVGHRLAEPKFRHVLSDLRLKLDGGW